MTMDSELGALLDHLTAIGQELSPDGVGALAKELEGLSGPDSLATGAGSTARTRALRERLKELWQGNPDVSPHALALAALSAQRAAETVDRAQIVELLWTGPTTPSVPVRRTDQALYEVIESAERELLVVSFAAYKVKRVIGAIGDALDRGVKVRFVLESDKESGGNVSFDPAKVLGNLTESVELCRWPLEKRPEDNKGHRGSLHAKCAVADRDLALVSSANLTDHALGLNMELGLMIRGGAIPRRIADHFRSLVRGGVLERTTHD